MKKMIALMLGLVMLFSLSTTAFAAGTQTGSMTLTAEVPDSVSYTMHIPADMTLEYNNTEKQLIGNVAVSDIVNLPDGKKIRCQITNRNLKCGTETIPVKYFVDDYDDVYPGGDSVLDYMDIYVYYDSPDSREIFAQVSQEAWDAATPGTYTATLTYTFYICE